jgi:DNA-binding transcriptional LysR family regulator
MSDYVATVLMSRVLPEIQRQAPGVTFQIFAPATDALDRGDADLAILPQQFLAGGHPSEPLFEDEFVCIACPSNRGVKRALSMRDYLRLPHVAIRFGEQQQVPSIEEQFSPDRHIEVITAGFTLVPQLILGTNRIATVPRRLADLYAGKMPLKLAKPPREIPPLVETMQWHTLRRSDPALSWLRSVLKTFAQHV